jgi:glucose-6-phosphate-specific signal transduction histidine kinase
MKSKKILNNLKENSSVVFLITLIAVLLTFVIQTYFKKEISESFFYITHAVHVFAFAIICSALFFKHRKSPIFSLIIGFTGSIILASLSDVIIPLMGGIVFHLNPSFHLPLIKNTFIILSTALIGSLIGIETKFEKIPLFIQIILSVFAGLFYLISFTKIPESWGFISVTIIVFISALITNCIRDMVFPVIFFKKH